MANTELHTHAHISGDLVRVTFELKNHGPEHQLGTLRMTQADYAIFHALLRLGSDVMRIDYQYELKSGNQVWTQQEDEKNIAAPREAERDY